MDTVTYVLTTLMTVPDIDTPEELKEELYNGAELMILDGAE